jgi:two-component system cell cycle sensor histidine kinase/response regulator CckA
MTNHLTKPLPAFTRQQVLHAAPLDVNELLTEMTGMLDRLIGATSYVALALAPNLPLALADRGQVEQVVMNLVVNARSAMPHGGSVTIETAAVELENSPFHEEAVTQGHYVMLAITDSGSGMTKDSQRHVSEPLFASKETGHGAALGPSTTYDIVKQSNGYTWVYSEPGRGTTFKVYLPRANRDDPLPAFSPMIATPGKSASATVLLVDDDAGVRQFSKRILDGAGYRVFEAANGDAAETLFAQHADSIDLVVTDVIMPGCGGTELLGRLRLRAPAVRVLYMSGYRESVSQRTGIDRGLPFVEKPFTVDGFVRRVREALNR